MNEQKLKNRKTLKPRGVKIKLRQGDRENKKKTQFFFKARLCHQNKPLRTEVGRHLQLWLEFHLGSIVWKCR
jgi:hypothetical protein